MAIKRVVHGDDLIYPFLRDLFREETSYGPVARSLLAATAVWLPIEAYSALPIMAPYVVRDPSCRGRKGAADEWSSPNSGGYLRDDNSMIKNIPRSLSIQAPRQKHLNGRHMATEFVAAHVWRVATVGGALASRRPLLNSFIPNVVWLPGQIAKLSDLEGSTVQQTLQEMSWARYREAEVAPHLQTVVEDAWEMLPEPPTSHAHDFESWNYFVPTDRFMHMRQARIGLVLQGIKDVLAGRPLDRKVISTRYTRGLPHVNPDALVELEKHLSRFCMPACPTSSDSTASQGGPNRKS